jgi:hypothetical protein
MEVVVVRISYLVKVYELGKICNPVEKYFAFLLCQGPGMHKRKAKYF